MVLGAALLCWGVSVVIGDGPGERRDAGHLEVRNPRVVVLKSKRKLHLFDGDRLVRTYRIGLGLSPVGQKGSRDDNRTPEGAFRVCIRNPESRYHRFLGVSYPDPAAAERALRQGVLSQGEYAEIIEAHANHRCPPWTTGLGGGIGIHGHGADSDWTAGCIALDDDDVDELFRVLRLGDEVEILP
jgi:murein L,D-transpeptidase YafK